MVKTTNHNDPHLFHLKHAYATLTPTNRIKWPEMCRSDDVQDYVIQHILLDDHLKSYPPDTMYQRSYWKWLLYKMEESGAEVDTRLYEHYLSLTSDASKKSSTYCLRVIPPRPSFVTHYWIAGRSDLDCRQFQRATSMESRTLIEQGTTGMRTWPASLFLAKFLVSQPEIVRAKVLELGCGTGFLGIIVAHLQLLHHSDFPFSLCLTDVNESVLQRCKENMFLACNVSRSHPRVELQMLDWKATQDEILVDSLKTLLKDYDASVIIGADLVYDISIIPCLVAALKIALCDQGGGNQSKCAYIALTIRNENTVGEFFRIAGESLHLAEICRSSTFSEPFDNFPMNSDEDVRIYLLTKRPQ